jgi:hypothetical protein
VSLVKLFIAIPLCNSSGISDIIRLFDGKRVDLEFYPETEPY